MSAASKSVLVFDVNETLLDLRALRPVFEVEIGGTELLPVWFGQMLRNSLIATITETYRPFDELGVAALRLVTKRAGAEVAAEAAERVVGAMRELPAHPDVRPALERLRDAGFTLVTLTNSSPSMVHEQIHNAGLADLFDELFSVEAARRFKPSEVAYRSAADRLGAPIGELRLIAAHNWDVTGAIRAGMKAAFVARSGMFMTEVDERPDIVAVDLGGIADALAG
jgi:2-haloacid dehalogenase